MVADDPGHLTLEWRKADRGKRIYVDVNRIAYAQHAVGPYAVRATTHGAGRGPAPLGRALGQGAQAGRLDDQDDRLATSKKAIPGRA